MREIFINKNLLYTSWCQEKRDFQALQTTKHYKASDLLKQNQSCKQSYMKRQNTITTLQTPETNPFISPNFPRIFSFSMHACKPYVQNTLIILA